MFDIVLNMPLNGFETEKEAAIIQAGNYAQHVLIFFTNSKLDMLISVMFMKKKRTPVKNKTFQMNLMVNQTNYEQIKTVNFIIDQ